MRRSLLFVSNQLELSPESVPGKAVSHFNASAFGLSDRYRFGAGITRYPGETVMRGDEPRLFQLKAAPPVTDSAVR
jgi:hypothetical protein